MKKITQCYQYLTDKSRVSKKLVLIIALYCAFGVNAQIRQVNGWGQTGGSPNSFCEFDGKLYFVAQSAGFNRIYSSDGTTASLQAIGSNSNLLYNSTSTTFFNVFNSELYFDASATNLQSRNIYKIAVGSNNANLVFNMFNSTNFSNNRFVDAVFLNDKIFFTPFTLSVSPGIEPYIIDINNSANSGVLLDIKSGADDSNPRYFKVLNSNVFFAAGDGVNGRELWKTDGTGAGTVLFQDINLGAGDSNPDNFNVLGVQLTFAATHPTLDRELFKTNGNVGNLVLIKDINTSGDSNPTNVTEIDGLLYFSADNGTNGYELWKSNGFNSGTTIIKDINPTGDSNPSNFVKLGNEVFFTANDGVNGVELWKTDGTSNGTVLVKNIKNNIGDSNPSYLTVYNGKLYFIAEDDSFYKNLWVSDGTTIGTVAITTIVSTSAGVNLGSGLFLYSNELYFGFYASSTSGAMLYAYKDPALSVNDFQLNENSVSLFPNPTNNYFEIQSNSTLDKVDIYSLQGQSIKSFIPQNQYDISDLSSGVYFVKIQANNSEITKRIIKE